MVETSLSCISETTFFWYDTAISDLDHCVYGVSVVFGQDLHVDKLIDPVKVIF